MKKKIITLFLCIPLFTMAYASGYEENMRKAGDKFNEASTTEQIVNVINMYERLAEANKQEWLPLYYASYACLSAGYKEENSDKKDQLYQEGLTFIERAKTIRKNESELLAMEGYLKLMYIANKPMLRAPTQTGEALGILKQAKELDPSNPRPWLIQGQNTFHTPSFFGGGAEKARPMLEKAMALYKTFNPSGDLMPSWGQQRCEQLLGECKAKEAEALKETK